MPVNHVYKCTAKFTHPQGDGEMIFNPHYRMTTQAIPVSTQQEAAEIADTFNTVVETQYMPLLPVEFNYVGCDVIGITDPTAQAVRASNTPGSDAGQAVALRNAPVVKLTSGLRGRSFNGRLFLMAPQEGQQAAGVIEGTYISSLAVFIVDALNLTSILTSNVYEMTIYSPTLSLGGPVVDNLVTGAVVNPKFGTQRSRQKVV